MIWDKENGIAPAFTVRFSHEYLLWFYKKGKMLKPVDEMRGKYTTVIREPSTKHSKKPTEVYEMLENMFPQATKIELFARTTRNGWDCWGNEV
jgi:N6-adenosine-specific RNA methylase IME4